MIILQQHTETIVIKINYFHLWHFLHRSVVWC